jgi:DNA-binding NtrC family response regulator
MDLGILVAALLRRLVREKADAVRFTPAAGVALLRYDWPLNARFKEVADAMGKARMQVHRWCKRFGIDPNLYRR